MGSSPCGSSTRPTSQRLALTNVLRQYLPRSAENTGQRAKAQAGPCCFLTVVVWCRPPWWWSLCERPQEACVTTFSHAPGDDTLNRKMCGRFLFVSFTLAPGIISHSSLHLKRLKHIEEIKKKKTTTFNSLILVRKL